ncbi:hypothetical protein AGLY_010990 [Aphis glycines]|uniref:Reverse transcriptase domain-containing protein n=1 Tax=Aphis glycines TaxID=307491 RepID=A0A6G0TCS3_APHGL|nr:hypothetical protein AGLY_010990 [Aphis glycines]
MSLQSSAVADCLKVHTILLVHLHNVVEVNAAFIVQELNPTQQLYCTVVIDAGSTGTKILVAAFKKKIRYKPPPPKKNNNDKSYVKNYHPIFELVQISKLFEKLILIKFIKPINNIINNNQHSFRPVRVSHPLLSWFNSYLINKFQFTRVHGFFSNMVFVPSESLQGGHSSFILFELFINGTSSVLKKFHLLLIVDDLKIFTPDSSYFKLDKYTYQREKGS